MFILAWFTDAFVIFLVFIGILRTGIQAFALKELLAKVALETSLLALATPTPLWAVLTGIILCLEGFWRTGRKTAAFIEHIGKFTRKTSMLTFTEGTERIPAFFALIAR
jgi:hypothetical protein